MNTKNDLLFIEKMLLPKSTNPGNLDDYIYLDTLQFGHGDLLSFEQKRITKSNLFEYISDDRETSKYTFLMCFIKIVVLY